MILTEKDYWERFEQSGRIDDYMAFKNYSAIFSSPDEEFINADYNKGNSNT